MLVFTVIYYYFIFVWTTIMSALAILFDDASTEGAESEIMAARVEDQNGFQYPPTGDLEAAFPNSAFDPSLDSLDIAQLELENRVSQWIQEQQNLLTMGMRLCEA